ncbi:hypothetical protein SBA5_250119 [Candidatus Sulfotelmatomonas gaucii]|uniref:Uncharacterized protein n=1 Tax=Candidatus Sulfuritelmatomonas gaucii TaxID=2043161 RepID=A0A2N9L9C6_9BACT|nr:hypothetical protein SBA5_250119 [Candidatus Sulfotelmatomonas gaucii]
MRATSSRSVIRQDYGNYEGVTIRVTGLRRILQPDVEWGRRRIWRSGLAQARGLTAAGKMPKGPAGRRTQF